MPLHPTTFHTIENNSDESVICLDSDSSIISIRSSDPPACAYHDAIDAIDEGYSSDDDDLLENDLDGFSLIKRLYSAMDSFASLDEREADKRFWTSNIVKDIKCYLYHQDRMLRRFVKDIMKPDSIIFNYIPKKLWGFIRGRSEFYGISVESRQNDKDAFLVMKRQSGTYIPRGWKNHLDMIIFEFVNNFWKQFIGCKVKNTIEVDPILSIGYQMLIKMGWKPGTPLGIRDGILEPIVLLNGRTSKSGLGIEDYF